MCLRCPLSEEVPAEVKTGGPWLTSQSGRIGERNRAAVKQLVTIQTYSHREQLYVQAGDSRKHDTETFNHRLCALRPVHHGRETRVDISPCADAEKVWVKDKSDVKRRYGQGVVTKRVMLSGSWLTLATRSSRHWLEYVYQCTRIER